MAHGHVQPDLPGGVGPGPNRRLQLGPDLFLPGGHGPILLAGEPGHTGVGLLHGRVAVLGPDLRTMGRFVLFDYILFKTCKFFRIGHGICSFQRLFDRQDKGIQPGPPHF